MPNMGLELTTQRLNTHTPFLIKPLLWVRLGDVEGKEASSSRWNCMLDSVYQCII